MDSLIRAKAAFRELTGDDQRRFRRWIVNGDELSREERVAAAVIHCDELIASGETPMEAERLALATLDFSASDLWFDFKNNPRKHSRVRVEIKKALKTRSGTTDLSHFHILLKTENHNSKEE